MADEVYANGDAGPAQVLGAQSSGDLLESYANAIAKVESGGRYGATGPTTRSGDRAYGKYQVMGANVPAWTKEALGRELTPSEFLASPEAQDQVFRHKFGQYVSKYGNPSDAASAWFTGQPLSKGATRADQLGTTGARYVDLFNAVLGKPSGNAQDRPTNALASMGQSSNVDSLLGLGNELALVSKLVPKPIAATASLQDMRYPAAQQASVQATAPFVDFSKVAGPAVLPKFEVGKSLKIVDARGQPRMLHPVAYDPFEGGGVS